MFIGNPQGDIGANAQTGHPCVVVPYKFDVPQQGGGRGGPGPAVLSSSSRSRLAR